MRGFILSIRARTADLQILVDIAPHRHRALLDPDEVPFESMDAQLPPQVDRGWHGGDSIPVPWRCSRTNRIAVGISLCSHSVIGNR
jgi:hypothetical protein